MTNNENTQFDIGVSYQEDVPTGIIDGLVEALESNGSSVESRERPIGVYMSLEWAIPTAIVVYLAKPYFDGFLSEAGKDHYTALKLGILKITSRLLSSDSGAEKRRISSAFSVQSTTTNGLSVKFTFPDGLEDAQYSKMVERMQEMLKAHHVSASEDHLSQLINGLEGNSRNYYLEYCQTENDWIMIDQAAEIRRKSKM